MKKICAVCQVKDDADVIESFCRYHLVFLDALVIWDDNSSDATPEIVRKMIEEGLPIELKSVPPSVPLERDFLHYHPRMVNSRCIETMNRYDADWVLSLDVDEFLFCEDGQNPRHELEMLDEATEHLMYWRTSVYNREPTDSKVFLPNYFEEYRDPALESFPKTILSRYLAEKYGAVFEPGWHGLEISDEDARTAVPKVIHPLLRVAHFPIRSVAHAIVKVVCMHLRFFYVKHKLIQYEKMYCQIKQTGIPTHEQVRQLSLEYALFQEQLGSPIGTIRRFRGALSADFLSDEIQLLYTDYQKSNYMGAILSFFEGMLDKIAIEAARPNEPVEIAEHVSSRKPALIMAIQKLLKRGGFYE